MKAKLLGVQTLDFTNDQGQKVSGCTIHIAYESFSEYMEGLTVTTKFLSSTFLKKFDLTTSDLVDMIDHTIGLDCDLNKHIVDIYAVEDGD